MTRPRIQIKFGPGVQNPTVVEDLAVPGFHLEFEFQLRAPQQLAERLQRLIQGHDEIGGDVEGLHQGVVEADVGVVAVTIHTNDRVTVWYGVVVVLEVVGHFDLREQVVVLGVLACQAGGGFVPVDEDALAARRIELDTVQELQPGKASPVGNIRVWGLSFTDV